MSDTSYPTLPHPTRRSSFPPTQTVRRVSPIARPRWPPSPPPKFSFSTKCLQEIRHCNCDRFGPLQHARRFKSSPADRSDRYRGEASTGHPHARLMNFHRSGLLKYLRLGVIAPMLELPQTENSFLLKDIKQIMAGPDYSIIVEILRNTMRQVNVASEYDFSDPDLKKLRLLLESQITDLKRPKSPGKLMIIRKTK